METVGYFQSERWGRVEIVRAQYGTAKGATAIQLYLESGEPLATLSVNMYKPECSQDSTELPADCFYAKTWSENEEIAKEALESGMFALRKDLPAARSGFVMADVWQIKGD